METVNIDDNSAATATFSIAVVSNRAHLETESAQVLEVRKHIEVSVSTFAPSIGAGASRAHKRSAAVAFTERALSSIQIERHARS